MLEYSAMCQENDELRGKLIERMKCVFGADERRINHALRVLGYAEDIMRVHGGDAVVIRAAAVLHDIGIQEAERKHGSAAGRYQEIEGPPIARRIMEEQGVEAEQIEHVCRIIASHHSANDIDTLEFRTIWDADWIVNIPEVWPSKSGEELRRAIEKTLRTERGRRLAVGIHCKTS